MHVRGLASASLPIEFEGGEVNQGGHMPMIGTRHDCNMLCSRPRLARYSESEIIAF